MQVAAVEMELWSLMKIATMPTSWRAHSITSAALQDARFPDTEQSADPRMAATRERPASLTDFVAVEERTEETGRRTNALNAQSNDGSNLLSFFFRTGIIPCTHAQLFLSYNYL